MLDALVPHIFLGQPPAQIKAWIIDKYGGDVDVHTYVFLQDLNANLGDEDGQNMIVIEEEQVAQA